MSKKFLKKRIIASVMAVAMAFSLLPSTTVAAEEANDEATVGYEDGFQVWFNSDGATGLSQGQYGEYPIFAGEDMAAKTNKITVDGVEHYSVQGTNNPKKSGSNPNGAIPDQGAYLEVVAPQDGSITVYGYEASGKPFYATCSDTAALTDGNAFCNDSHSYTVTVREGEAWYFYAQGSKAQFVGVTFELPKASVSIPVSFSGAELNGAMVSFTNKTTKDVVEIGESDSSVTLTEGYKYEVAIESASLTIDVTEVDLTASIPEVIAIHVEEASKHVVSGTIKGLPEGAVVTSLTMADESGALTEAVVDGLQYSLELKNGNYTTSATVEGADGYTVYDHVAVAGTEGEAISNDVWFYAPATTYASEYQEVITAGTNGDYATITEAVAAVKAMSRTADQWVTIKLLDAEYAEQVIVNTDRVRLVAAEGVTPVVRWYYGIGYKYYSLDSTGYYNEKNANDKYEMNYAQRWGTTVRVTGTGFYAEGIQFINTFNIAVCEEELGDSKVGDATEYGQSISGSLQDRVLGLDVANGTNVERAAAMVTDGDQAEFYNCSFVSSQDTLYTGSKVSYFNNCKVVGQTDYIFGNTGCSAVFDNCELQWLGYTAGSKAGYVTATRGSYLFRGCQITSNKDAGYTVTPGYFGRPWGNTAAVTFLGTEIEENAVVETGWYAMSGVNPEDVSFKEYGNTVNGTNFYTTYSKDTEKYNFQISKDDAEKLADPANDSSYLGTWVPVNQIKEAYDLSKVSDWATTGTTDSDEEEPSESEEQEETASQNEKVYTFEASSLTAFAAGAKADGDEEKAGTDNYFTLIYSAKTKVDSSSKVFEDEYASSQRVNFGGAASTEKNAVKITTEYDNASVKIWWVEGGDDNRQMAILDASGAQVAVTDVTAAKNACVISTLEIETAGTYYIGGATNNNYIFKIEVTETVPVIVNTYDLEASSLTAFAAGAKADGDEEKAGTDNFFTLIYSAKSKVDSSSKVFEDEYASSQRVNFGGAVSTEKNAVKFTTEGTASVKVWWVEGGDDNRQMAILDASGAQVAVTDVTVAKNACAISTFELTEAGTYYLGGATNNNYIFKVEVVDTIGGSVVKPARKEWALVENPTVSAELGANGTIVATVEMTVGYDGADKVTVNMYDAEGTLVSSKNSSAEKASHSLAFTPSASGDYTFSVVASREGEEDKVGNTVLVTGFILPLTAPAVNSVTNKGNGSVEVSWDPVTEAEYYIVTVDGVETLETAETTVLVTGLVSGNTYTIGVKAARSEEDKTSIGTTAQILVADEVQRTWASSTYGSSVDSKNNGYSGSVSEGSVTVYSENGKGKIVPGSTDGLTFYYTKIDPETENFTLRANVHVNNWTLSNGQEGFGLMVSDTVGPNGDGTAFWNNSYQLLGSKVEYYWDGEAVTSDTTADKITMKLGFGVTAKTGVTADDVAAIKAGTITMPAGFSTTTVTMETSCAQMGTGTYNVIGNYTGVEPTGDQGDADYTDVIMEIQRNNTGYIMRLYDVDGNLLGEKLYYDLERNALTQIDSDSIYVGFFASRNARMTASDISFTTINPADDEAAQERELEEVYPSYVFESASTANTSSYDLVFLGNADGIITITDDQGNAVVSEAAIAANTKTTFTAELHKGMNTFTAVFTPDKDYVPGEFMVLTSYEPATITVTVDYEEIEGNTIYVSNTGSASGDGTKENPVDIYTAVQYAKAGQTIVLAGGEYNLTKTVKVDRGINGTAEQMIYMIADKEATERPVFDFGKNCEGMVLAGDYWYFQGFDVTKSADGKDGIRLCGNHNVVDGVNCYMNGNTGLQISRYLTSDEKDQWPSYNLVLNCTSYLNADKGYEDADGFAAKLTVGDGNVFDGCIAHHNADDGWDLFAKVQTGSIGSVTIQNSVAYMNGYVLTVDGKKYSEITFDGIVTDAGNGNGFKMGGDSMSGYHHLINSVAFANKAKGFDSNSCPDIQVTRSTSFDNESYNVAFYTNTAVNTDFAADGVLSYKKSNSLKEQFKLLGTQDESKVYGTTNYYFDGSVSANSEGTTVSDDWFVNLDTQAAINGGVTRNADGTINMNGYLVLTDKAPEGVGARMSGTPSSEIEIPETPVEETEIVTDLGTWVSGNYSTGKNIKVNANDYRIILLDELVESGAVMVGNTYKLHMSNTAFRMYIRVVTAEGATTEYLTNGEEFSVEAGAKYYVGVYSVDSKYAKTTFADYVSLFENGMTISFEEMAPVEEVVGITFAGQEANWVSGNYGMSKATLSKNAGRLSLEDKFSVEQDTVFTASVTDGFRVIVRVTDKDSMTVTNTIYLTNGTQFNASSEEDYYITVYATSSAYKNMDYETYMSMLAKGELVVDLK